MRNGPESDIQREDQGWRLAWLRGELRAQWHARNGRFKDIRQGEDSVDADAWECFAEYDEMLQSYGDGESEE